MTKIILPDTVDESTDFYGLIGKQKKTEICFDFSKVKQINASGVRQWVSFIQGHKETIKISIEAVSPCVVEQMNLVEGFLEGVAVRSLLLPFTCHQCTHEHLEGVPASEFSKVKKELPAVNCSQCHLGEMEFDYILEEYFYFLTETL